MYSIFNPAKVILHSVVKSESKRVIINIPLDFLFENCIIRRYAKI